MNEIIQLVRDYGLPYVLVILFYIDFREIIKKNTETIQDLKTTINKLKEAIRAIYKK